MSDGMGDDRKDPHYLAVCELLEDVQGYSKDYREVIWPKGESGTAVLVSPHYVEIEFVDHVTGGTRGFATPRKDQVKITWQPTFDESDAD